METPLIIAHISCGPLMTFLFFLFYKFPPKKINTLYGYRTNRSMKNKEVWDFANTYSTKLLLNFSLLTCIIQLVFIYKDPYSETLLLISWIIFILFLGLGIWKTELELNKYFDKKGDRL